MLPMKQNLSRSNGKRSEFVLNVTGLFPGPTGHRADDERPDDGGDPDVPGLDRKWRHLRPGSRRRLEPGSVSGDRDAPSSRRRRPHRTASRAIPGNRASRLRLERRRRIGCVTLEQLSITVKKVQHLQPAVLKKCHRAEFYSIINRLFKPVRPNFVLTSAAPFLITMMKSCYISQTTI